MAFFGASCRQIRHTARIDDNAADEEEYEGLDGKTWHAEGLKTEEKRSHGTCPASTIKDAVFLDTAGWP